MEQFMTSEEIAELLHVDPATVRRLVNRGELSAYRIGADYRFAPSDLEDYLQRQRISARAQSKSGASSSRPLDQFAQWIRSIIQEKHTTPSDLIRRYHLFTDRARHVLTLAQEEAQQFQHSFLGTEHLLLGLLSEREGVASQVLSNLGIEADRVRSAVEARIGRGEGPVTGEASFTPRAKKVMELAVNEAHHLKHHYIGTEHLLLGLICEGEGVAACILKSLDLQLEQVRTETLRVLREPKPGQEEAPAVRPAPVEATTWFAEDQPDAPCSSCGTLCPGSFRYCFNCGQPLTHEASSHDEAQ